MQRRGLWLTGTVLMLAAVAIYLEFAIDIRTPRSPLKMQGALATHNGLPAGALAAAATAFKAKFGEATEVWQGPAGINAKLNGRIVATEPAHTVFHEALGITQIADGAGAISTFPFDVSPYQLLNSMSAVVLPILKMEVEAVAPISNPDFDLKDFSIEHCRMFSNLELAGFGKWLLNLKGSTVCTIIWKRTSRRLLIGIAATDGEWWLRPFVRGACRALSRAWLANDRQVNPNQQPDYLQCLIVDRPENNPNGSGVATLAYEIRKDGSLARFEQSPRLLRMQPLKPNKSMPVFRHVEASDPSKRPDAR
jgi:hypothetical protein